MFLGLLDVCVAYNLILPETAKAPLYQAFASILPLSWSALAWFTIGIVCFSQVFSRADRLAYTLAVGLKVGWALEYFVAEWVYEVTRAWVGGVTWLGAASLVFVISTWPEYWDGTPPEYWDGGLRQ